MSDVRAAAERIALDLMTGGTAQEDVAHSLKLYAKGGRYIGSWSMAKLTDRIAEHMECLSGTLSDDDVELDQDWIEANCHRKLDTDDDLYEWVIFRETVLLLDKYGRTMVSQIEDGATRIISVDTVQLRDCNTRGDVQRLLRALGVEVRG